MSGGSHVHVLPCTVGGRVWHHHRFPLSSPPSCKGRGTEVLPLMPLCPHGHSQLGLTLSAPVPAHGHSSPRCPGAPRRVLPADPVLGRLGLWLCVKVKF